MSEHFDVYMKAVGQALAQGQATEHTYRPALKALLEAHAPGYSHGIGAATTGDRVGV